MAHPFGNDENRFGSARFATSREIRNAGMLDAGPNGFYCGDYEGRPLYYHGDGGIQITAGARSGKLRDILGYNIISGTLSNVTLLILDPRGELAAISQDQTPDEKFCIYWNPFGLHGLPQHSVDPCSHLRWSRPTLFGNMKFFFAGLLPHSGAAQSRFFEQGGRLVGEGLGLSLVESNGRLTLPDLYEAVMALQEDGERWNNIAAEMCASRIPTCRSVEAQIRAARQDSSGGWKGILAELVQALSPLSDPLMRDSLSPPFDFTLEDLCSDSQAYQVYLMVPPEMIDTYASVIKAIFSSAMALKARRPQAPKQTWILDEAARLKGFDQVVQLFTYGAGSGIRPVAVFQDSKQAADLSANAEPIIASSAGLQLYFGVRDYTTGKRVSDMLGAETLNYNDPVPQGRAWLEVKKLVAGLFGGADPFSTAFEAAQKRSESIHPSKQHRLLRTPDEVMNTPEDRLYIFADGLPGAIYAWRAPYWTKRWTAGRYHPNPYHPPLDQVRVQTRWGPRLRPVITRKVPELFAHYPQYADGTYSFIGGRCES